jgi:outer membrane protein assembly factor BamB
MRNLWIGSALLLVLPAGLPAENWPGWRGPHGDGHSAEKEAPLTWGPKENIRWKVPLPGPGNSSPIVWGKRVFVTQALDGGRRAVLCFDRADGKELWRGEVTYEGKEPSHNTNPYCSATPVTDGERVIASHGSAGLVCYDMDGKELWRHDTGKQFHIWGNASSPILYGDLVILWCGPGERQFLLAVDKKTGKKVWRHDEPGGDFGKNSKKWIGSWSTPIVRNINGREELILSVPEKVKGFDPKTGKELWSCDGLGKLVYGSPVCTDDGIVIALSGFHGPGLAVRAGGNGDVTKTHRLWRQAKGIPQRIGSPVIVGKYAYLIDEPGTGRCFEPATGKDLWEGRRVTGATWGTPVYVAGRLYVTNVRGETVVFEPSPEYKQLARNRLGEMTRASLAVSDGELFLRTYKHLWCIGGK